MCFISLKHDKRLMIQWFKMYFKVKHLIWHYYKVHFLKGYLSLLRNVK